MSQPFEEDDKRALSTTTAWAEGRAPECYTRINITKNTKGYSFETTASIKWLGMFDAKVAMATLLRSADQLAREEIEIRERIDAGIVEDSE